MTCTRCGGGAIVKRGESYFCGRCAITKDWQELIGVIQDARVETPVAGQPERRVATA